MRAATLGYAGGSYRRLKLPDAVPNPAVGTATGSPTGIHVIPVVL